MITGAASLLVTAVWQGLVIRGEIKRDEKNAAAGVSEDQGTTQEGTQARQDLPATELATAFVGLGVLATTVQTGLVIGEVVTGDAYYETAAYSLLPIVGVLYVLAVALRPKDEGVGLKILHLQFFFFAIWSELAVAVGNFQGSYTIYGWSALLRIPFWLITYWLGLKLRRKAAQLPPAELSNFLCHTALVGGASAMAPMIFFIFEAVSCITSGDVLGDDQCENTTIAAMCLSVYLVIITAVAMASKTVPQGERGEGTTYSNLAILRLKMKEKVQGSLGVVTALVAMYLFSVLGVEGAQNWSILWVGLGGAMTLLVAAFIEFAYIVFGSSVSTGDDQAGSSSGSLGHPSNISAEQQLSFTNVEENMTVASLV